MERWWRTTDGALTRVAVTTPFSFTSCRGMIAWGLAQGGAVNKVEHGTNEGGG